MNRREFLTAAGMGPAGARGMAFTQAYAAAAVCTPTRASILTGRYPARLGITDRIRARRDGGVIGPELLYCSQGEES